jgi:archaellum component FlaC
MSTVTETDLKRLEDLINNRFDRSDAKIDGLDKRLTNVETSLGSIDGRLTKAETKLESIGERLAVIETRLNSWQPSIDKTADLAEKVGELKNWGSIAFLILGAVAGLPKEIF